MKNVVLVDDCRIPFLKAGTKYKNLMTYQLGKMAIRELLLKTELNPNSIDLVALGTVVHQIKTSNVAREAALAAGISYHTPCHTVSMACISANKAICDAIDQIALGYAKIAIAGGADCVSDIPIAFPKKMQQKLFEAQKQKTTSDFLRLAIKIRPNDFMPEIPTISEFTTQRTMGQDCDRLADRFEVSRQEQDVFALRSHHLAAKAQCEGILNQEIANAKFAPTFEPITWDNGIRGEATLEKMAQLKPAFTPHSGTLTAANSSFLTDGAATVLLMEEQTALALGYKPKAYIRQYAFTAQNPEDELLLGPTYATAKVLDKSKLNLNDIHVIEMHEAFAAQVIANIKCLNSDKFAQEKLNKKTKIGQIDIDKLNIWGGSLAIGHPFGATGARLVATAAHRLRHENAQFALIASCAAGAHGHAMIIENYPI